MTEHVPYITGRTMVFGVIGDPVGHTRSPQMHNAVLREMGFDAVYVPFRVPAGEAGAAIAGMRVLGIAGLNVTVPHKTAVISFLDELTVAASAVGAVNTIINHDGRLIGDNTDIYGFERCLAVDGGMEEMPERVVVLGAGGAARGVVYACAKNSGTREIYILNRTFEKAEALASEMETLTDTACIPQQAIPDVFSAVIPGCGLVVNTTSVGMHPDDGSTPVPDPTVFGSGQTVCDIIYNPLETRFLREAGAHGAKTVGGLAMLAYQGARSLSLWTGRDAPAEHMLAVLHETE